MKMKFKFLLSLFIFVPGLLLAQKPIKVEEEIHEMSLGTKSGFVVIVPEAILDNVKSDYQRLLRKDSKSRPEERKGELIMKGAVNKSISPNSLNIYSKLAESEDGVKITSYFTENDTLFFSGALNPDESYAIKKYLKNFAIVQYKKIVNEDLENQQRNQKSLENKLQELVKAKQNSERNISESKRTIENNKREIASAETQLTAKEEEIVKQKAEVSSLKGSAGDEAKLVEKNLKKLESEKRKIEKEKESLARIIDKMNGRIEDNQRIIDENLKQQAEKTSEIEKQKEKVNSLEEKLISII